MPSKQTHARRVYNRAIRTLRQAWAGLLAQGDPQVKQAELIVRQTEAAQHQMSGPRNSDAMQRRIPGSFEAGKRR